MADIVSKLTLVLALLLLLNPAKAFREKFDWLELEDEIKAGRWCSESGGSSCRDQYSKNTFRAKSNTTEDDKEWDTSLVIGPSYMNDSMFMDKAKCQCDEDCFKFGDCCYDAPALHRAWTAENNKREEFVGKSWTCLPLRPGDSGRPNDERFYMYMIADCPETWPDSSTIAYCQKIVKESDYTYRLDIPVLSLDTNLTYANAYCARCHSDANRLARWNASVECNQRNLEQYNVSQDDIINPSNYKPGMRLWNLTAGEDRPSLSCVISVEEFRNFSNYLKSTGGRRCIPKISKCPDDWSDSLDKIKCQAFTLLVTKSKPSKFSDVIAYNNHYCAKCNGISTNISCYYPPTPISPKWRTYSNNRNFYSFSMLIDFDFVGGGAGVAASGKEEPKCNANETFDSIHERCQPVICGANYINRNGVCVLIGDPADIEWPTEKWLNSSCKRVVLSEYMDYIQLENGSLVLNATGKLKHPEEYEPNSDGSNVTICIEEKEPDTYFRYSPFQRYLSDLCLIISVVCLALHIIIHIALPKLRNLPGKNLLSLSCALFMAQLLFLTGIGLRDAIGETLCATMGMMTHWFYLAAFFWMNVMGFDICRTFAGSVTRHRGMPGSAGQRITFVYYSLYAWGFPTLIVSLGLMMDITQLDPTYSPEYGSRVCWISNRTGLGVFFVLPVACLLFKNLILFSLTVFSILKQRRDAKFALDKKQSFRKGSETKSLTDRLQPPPGPVVKIRKSNNNKQKVRFILYIKLGLIMGLGWIFGFAAALAKVPILWYPFIFFNALQGAFIFFAFGFKRKVYYMMYQRITNRPHPDDTSSGSRTTASSSNKTNMSNQRISYTTSNNSTAGEIENHPRPSSLDIPISHGNASPKLADRLIPQMAAIEIVRQGFRSSPASRAKRNLPRVIVTKHFANCNAPNSAPVVVNQYFTSRLGVTYDLKSSS